MLFRSREKPSLGERIKLAVWPRVSWSRSIQYYKARVGRMAGSPHSVALGFAVGVAAAISPFVGFHIFIALGVGWLLRANLVATALGTALANPVTLPIIWGATYEAGRAILGHGHHEGAPDIGASFASRSLWEMWPILRTMLVGAVPVGIVMAAIAYFIAYQAVRAYRSMRASRRGAAGARPEMNPGGN